MPRDVPLGRVVHVSSRGDLLTRAPERLPVRLPGGGGAKDGLRVGESAADARREYVGRVSDVIGPVAKPYVVVQPPRGAKLHRLLGQDLYASPDAAPPRGPPRDARGPRGPGGPPRSADRRGPPQRDARGPPPRDDRRGPPRQGGGFRPQGGERRDFGGQGRRDFTGGDRRPSGGQGRRDDSRSRSR